MEPPHFIARNSFSEDVMPVYDKLAIIAAFIASKFTAASGIS
jgi:hypothetical protein